LLYSVVTVVEKRPIMFVKYCLPLFAEHLVEPPFWGRIVTTYDVRLGLIENRVVDFILVLIKPFSLGFAAAGATGENRSKIIDYVPTRSV